MGVTGLLGTGGRPGMGKALLISGSEKGATLMEPLLKENGFAYVTSVGSGAEARRCLTESDYSLIVINAPLKDELGDELAVWAMESTNAGAMLLIRQEQVDEIQGRVEEAGAMVLGKPINRLAFSQGVKLIAASHRRLLALASQNQALTKKLEDLRVVSRAKCLLIEKQHLSEADAHRYIEKRAMDSRQTRREVAQDVINQYTE